MTDEPLFDWKPRGRAAGSRRHGLEEDIRRARANGQELAAAGVASLRRLALELDAFRPAKEYGYVALAQLQHQFDDTYERVFGMGPSARDPLDALLDEIRRTETSDAEQPPAQ